MNDLVKLRNYDPMQYKITDPSQFSRPLWFMGTNWHRNNTEHTLPGYYPQVHIYRGASNITPSATMQSLGIDVSLPKLLFGNNLYELKDTDFPRICNTLSTRLQAMGIQIHPSAIANMQVEGIEYSKNILTRNIPVPYILQELYRSRVLNNFMDVQRTTFRNDGEELTFYSAGYEVAFYDKGLEMQKELKKNPTIQLLARLKTAIQAGKVNILRMEVRIHNNETLKEFIVNRVPLAKNTRFCSVYSQRISQYILISRWNELTALTRFMTPFVMSPSFELWKVRQRCGKNDSTQKLLARLGVRFLLREHGLIGAKRALKRIGCTNPATYIRQYAGRANLTLQKLDIWNYLDNMLSKFTCLDVGHWRGDQGQTRGPWFYKKESLMTPEQVGEWLNVTAGTVRRLIRNGYLKATQIYKQWRIQRCDVLEYLNAGV